MKRVLFAILLFLPICVHADYSIDNYRVDITINKNGDVDVVEAFSMSGIYNGFEKTIDYKGNYDGYRESKIISIDNTKLYNADDVTLNEIRAINFNMHLPIVKLINNSHLFTKTNKASKGEYGVYAINKMNNGNEYKIYNPSMFNKDFYINYTLDNLAIQHDDISEVGLRLFKHSKEKIKNMEINIIVPDNQNYLDAWVHTKDNYVITKDESFIKIKMNNISSNDFDIRVVYDKEALITNKKSNELVLDKILKIEKKYKDEALNDEFEPKKEAAYLAVGIVEKTKNKSDYERAVSLVNNLNSDELKTQLLVRLINVEPRVERKYILLKVAVTSCMSFIIVGILLIMYRMYAKESTCNIDRIPTKPYIIGYLYRKRITKSDCIASIVKLIDDGAIDIIKSKKDFKLIRKGNELNNVDDKLMHYIFDDDEITLSKLKKKINSRDSINLYTTWHNVAMDEAISKHYYEDLLSYKVFGISYALLGIIASALLLGKPTYFSPIITILISIMSIIFFMAFYKRTTIGSELFYQVMNIRQYINNIDKVKINKRAINEYLRYSIIFGNYDKASKVLTKIKDDDTFNNKIKVINRLLDI